MKINPEEAKAAAEKCKDTPGLVEHLISTKFLLRKINKLLKSTSNPTKLAFVLWPVFELFKHIRANYLKIENKQEKRRCFTLLVFN